MNIRLTLIILVGLMAMPLVNQSAMANVCAPSEPDLKYVNVVSFNIKWIGYYENERDNTGLASLLADCDIVVVQELVAPPDLSNDKIGRAINWAMPPATTYPNGKRMKDDPGSTAFFAAMKSSGFDRFVLSRQDTGPGDKLHVNSAATEWFVAFYKSSRVCSGWSKSCGINAKVGKGYIARDLSANADYQRVPYAFPFAAKGRNLTDFVLISVHLQPNQSTAARKRRAHELNAVAKWIGRQDQSIEADYLILGDMNIQNCTELKTATPAGFLSLNDECRDTVPSAASKPYDHVMFRPSSTKEVDTDFDLKVIDLIGEMRARWTVIGNGPYPGDPYKSRIFPKYFSDHNPIIFRMNIITDDD